MGSPGLSFMIYLQNLKSKRTLRYSPFRRNLEETHHVSPMPQKDRNTRPIGQLSISQSREPNSKWPLGTGGIAFGNLLLSPERVKHISTLWGPTPTHHTPPLALPSTQGLVAGMRALASTKRLVGLLVLLTPWSGLLGALSFLHAKHPPNNGSCATNHIRWW